MRRKHKTISWIAAFPGLLAVVWGMAVMAESGLTAAVWGQNALALLLGLLGIRLRAFCFRKNPKRLFAWMILGLLLLVAPFFFPGEKEVHRWILLGSVSIYVASLVLPGLLIVMGRWGQRGGGRGMVIVAFLTIPVLGLQPDVSQLTAFAAALFLLLLAQRAPAAGWSLVYGAIAVLIGWVWQVALPPVAHVEGIVEMAYALGESWGIASVVFLVLLPLPFLLAGLARHSALHLALAIYFTLILCSAGWGNFPVPLLGYGAAPIVGYFWSVSILANHYPD